MLNLVEVIGLELDYGVRVFGGSKRCSLCADYRDLGVASSGVAGGGFPRGALRWAVLIDGFLEPVLEAVHFAVLVIERHSARGAKTEDRVMVIKPVHTKDNIVFAYVCDITQDCRDVVTVLDGDVGGVSEASYLLPIREGKLDGFRDPESGVLLLLDPVLADEASAGASVYEGGIFLPRASLLFQSTSELQLVTDVSP